MAVKFSPLATEDVDSQVAYLATLERHLADEFLQQLRELVSKLDENHSVGTTEGIHLRGRPVYSIALRKFSHCRLFFVEQDGDVLVIRVLHTAQNWERMLDE